jgi:hypothetical protein
MTGVPIIELERVYHVGDLDPALRGSLHRSSQEGPCLSVSLCPEAWIEIARLGGSGLFALERDGAAFLDVHAAMADPVLRDAIVRWAESEGLIVFREQWKAWSFDEETETFNYFVARSREEAEREVDEFACGPDGGPAVELHMGYVATPELGSRLGCGRFDDTFTLDFAAMVWARDAAPNLTGRVLDGVWFREAYAPDHYSAPRGGIFPEALSRWRPLALPSGSVEDEDALDAMPETTLAPLRAAGPATAPAA